VDYAQARINMLKQQVRTFAVFDEYILSVMAKMPREAFVPRDFHQVAYADAMISLTNHRAMLPPKEIARALQALRVQPTEKVLLVGLCDGYLAALLAKLALQVYGVDTDKKLFAHLQEGLDISQLSNVSCVTGDYLQGWQSNAPYDAIVLSGSVSEVSQELLKNLKVGGRLFAIVGDGSMMVATLYKRESEDQWVKHKLFETTCPRVVGAVEPNGFEF
jgi:protein-L-isoaspartate(D-aspartate) O-methyltransferase